MFLFVYHCKSKWNHLYISILTCFFLMGCVSSDNNSNMITKIENLTGYYMTNQVTPENEHEFQKVPFEKAVNPSFQKNLSGKLRFVAIYKGTVPDAKIRSSNHLTLKLCDPVRTDVCSEKIIMPEKKATDIFNFKNNQLVDVFGIVSESSGMKIGGSTISHSQVGGLGAITFFQVWAMKPINSDEGHLNTSNLNKSKIIQKNSKNTFEMQNIRLIQAKLIKLGYNPGPVDGLMGSKTRKAIIQFQKDLKIKVTGIADSNTLIAMGLREGIVEYTSKKGSEKTESEKIEAVPSKSEEQEKNVQLKQPAVVKVVEEKTESEKIKVVPSKSEEQEKNVPSNQSNVGIAVEENVSSNQSNVEKTVEKKRTIRKGKLIKTTFLLLEPSFIAETIKEISTGQQLELLEETGEFYKVRYQGTEGYICVEFVTEL